jgi:hypothetical protein
MFANNVVSVVQHDNHSHTRLRRGHDNRSGANPPSVCPKVVDASALAARSEA